MTFSNHRSSRVVLIPWVITLVAMVGLNALVPNQMRVRKNDSLKIAGLSQITEEAQTPARLSSLPQFLAPQPTQADRAIFRTSQLLRIDTSRQQVPLDARGGAIRGRAPPTGPLA